MCALVLLASVASVWPASTWAQSQLPPTHEQFCSVINRRMNTDIAVFPTLESQRGMPLTPQQEQAFEETRRLVETAIHRRADTLRLLSCPVLGPDQR